LNSNLRMAIFKRGKKAPAAKGIATVLYPRAQTKFSLILEYIVCAISIETRTSVSFEFTNTTEAVSMAISVPAPKNKL